jgi:predicted dehydrogenase
MNNQGNSDAMKFFVIGCGSIGRRHIKNLIDLGEEVIVSDINPENRKWAEEKKIKTFEKSEDALLQKPDAVFVCTPPSTHVLLTKMALETGSHVFVEKPVSHEMNGIDELAKIATEKNLVIAVGYNLRFNKSLEKVRELANSGKIGKILFARIIFGHYLPDWRPAQDYKKSYSASKSLGGGIILDSSHELDYARWLFGDAKEISCMARKVSNLEVDTEDVAEINITFKSGVIANVHLDFIRRDYQRKCEIIGEKGTVSWDHERKKGMVELYLADKKETEVFDLSEEYNKMYVREIEQFIDCIKNKKEPMVSLEEGKRSLILALKAKESSETGKTLTL